MAALPFIRSRAAGYRLGHLKIHLDYCRVQNSASRRVLL
jgi:hypothetical protein